MRAVDAKCRKVATNSLDVKVNVNLVVGQRYRVLAFVMLVAVVPPCMDRAVLN